MTEGFIGATGLLSGRGSIAPSLICVRCRHADMKNILVVDDEFDILTTWRLVLQMEGYEVVTASNGLLALDSARAHLPDLIITDWMMPTHGRRRADPRTRRRRHSRAMPVVLLSAAARTPHGSRIRASNFIASRFPSTTCSRSSRA